MAYIHNVPYPARSPDSLRRVEEMVGNLLNLRSSVFSELFDPRRDIDDECGYPRSEAGIGIGSINIELYRNLYERECVATRVVQVLPKESWQVQPFVFESDDPDTITPFEEAWDDLSRSLFGTGGKSWYQDEKGSQIWEHLKRADILAGIGHFGVLLMGIDDGLALDQPVEGVVSLTPQDTTHNMSLPAPWPGLKGSTRSTWGKKGWESETINTEPLYKAEADFIQQRQQTWNQLLANGNRSPRSDPYSDNGRRTSPADVGYRHNPTEPTGRALTIDGWDPFGTTNELPVTRTETPGSSPGASGAVGTDAQYVGIQLSPPEFPSTKPSDKARRLTFLRSFDEALVQIVQYEANVRNPRFGQPVMYRITLNDPREMHSGIGLPMATVRVHWSRILHLADNLGSSEIFGVPRQRPVLNRLLDLRKLYSGSAEMYWRGAFPGLSLETNPQLGGDVEVDISSVQGDMEQYFNGLQRYLLLMGMSAKTLSPTVVDPTPQIETQIQAICIQLGIPQRVFMGSERGELASAQDDSAWNDRLKERQTNYITPRVIVPFVDRLIQMGVLPEPDGYSVEWPDVESNSEAEKSAIALQRTQALSAYVTGQVESLMNPLAYLTEVMGMEEESAQAIIDDTQQAHEDEDTMTAPPMIGGRPAAAPPGTQDHADAKAQADQAAAALAAKPPPGAGPAKPIGTPKPPTGNTKAGVDAITTKIAEYTEEQLEGLLVYVNPDLGIAVIDRMDWYDKSSDADPATEIGKTAEKQWGKERVIYQNEGPHPRGNGWITLNEERVYPKPPTGNVLGRKPYYTVIKTHYHEPLKDSADSREMANARTYKTESHVYSSGSHGLEEAQQIADQHMEDKSRSHSVKVIAHKYSGPQKDRVKSRELKRDERGRFTANNVTTNGNLLLTYSLEDNTVNGVHIIQESDLIHEEVMNWCNQHGGTTCKPGSAGAKAMAGKSGGGTPAPKTPTPKLPKPAKTPTPKPASTTPKVSAPKGKAPAPTPKAAPAPAPKATGKSAAGAPCKQGQSAARTGCTPKGKGGAAAKGASAKPAAPTPAAPAPAQKPPEASAPKPAAPAMAPSPKPSAPAPAPQPATPSPKPADTAKALSDKADALSKKANESGKAEDHSAARQAHRDAAKAHKDAGNTTKANEHVNKAIEHADAWDSAPTPTPAAPAPKSVPDWVSKSKNLSGAASTTLNHLTEGMGKLDEASGNLHATGAVNVCASMPDKVHEILQNNLGRVSFHADQHDLGQSVSDMLKSMGAVLPQERLEKLQNRPPNGLHLATSSTSSVMVDNADGSGSAPLAGKDYSQIERGAGGTLAHELTHSIDGAGPAGDGSKGKHTDTPAWKRAFSKEIDKSSRLSSYGATDKNEGFAEFGRLLYGTKYNLDSIQKQFPECSAYFKNAGLWPNPRGDRATSNMMIRNWKPALPEIFSHKVTLEDIGHADMGFSQDTTNQVYEYWEVMA